jgi:hypothetical protein
MIIDGTNGLTFNNATTQNSAGSVLQVVNATYSTLAINNTSTYADTGLTATITPKFSTSKILVLAGQNGVSKVSNNTYVNIQLLRNSTVIGLVEGIGSNGGTTNARGYGIPMNYLDSPATTSAVTYKTQFCSQNNNSSAYCQDSGPSTTTSTITLLEIAG